MLKWNIVRGDTMYVQVTVFVEAVALAEEEFVGAASVYMAVLEVARIAGMIVMEDALYSS